MHINEKVLIKQNISAEAIDLRPSRHPDRVGIVYSILEDAQKPMFLLKSLDTGFEFPLGGFLEEDLEVLEEVC